MLRVLEIILISLIGGSLFGLLLHHWVTHYFNKLTGAATEPPPTVTAQENATAHDAKTPTLEQLFLDQATLRRLTGLAQIERLQKPRNYYLPSVIGSSVVLVGLLAFSQHDELASLFGIMLGGVSAGLWFLTRRARQWQQQHRVLLGLLKEVKNYNTIVNNIKVLDQLRAVGNPVQLTDRDKVIKALIINRRDLVRALNTERILRENPDFNPEQFKADLTALQALQVTEKSSEYSELLDIALNVGMRLQAEMQQFTPR
jgi:hypothetical protein